MKKSFFAVTALATFVGLLVGYTTHAQQSTAKTSESDEIIIRRKGDKNEKLTVEFKDGQVTVNGKPMSEYNDNDVSISTRRTREIQRPGQPLDIQGIRTVPSSPFRGGTFNMNDNQAIARGYRTPATASGNKALLGVTTEKNEDGLRITSISKGSAAEKAGLREGDIITKIDNTSVESPEDLTKAIGKFSPEDKATVTYKRDKKEQKTAVTLKKREDATTLYSDAFNNQNFNFDMLTPGADGQLNMIMRGNNLRLGLKAQDTEDGKGVKVIDVDDASNAAKAGIKEGDIITNFNEKSVNSVGDLMDAAKDMKDKSSVKVRISREGKAQEMEIRVPKRLKTASL